MSLILEALRKLEREKQAPDRGFLVMAHTPWGAGRRWSSLGLAGLVVLVAMAASILTAFVLRGGRAPAAQRAAAPASPTAAAGSPPAGSTVRPQPVAAAATLPPATTSPAAPAALPQAPVLPAAPAASPLPEPAPSVSPDFRLMAISQQDGKPVAIVNDRLVREGDAFDGIRILRIGATEVEVEVRGQKRVLTFQ